MEQSLMDFTRNISEQHPMLAFFFFFISAALQILFPPYPGDTVLILEGYLSSKNYFNIYAIAFNAMAATFISCLMLYYISYKLGDSIFNVSFINKYFSRDKIHKLTKWFEKYGSIAILLSKFVPGVGSLTMLVAGTFKVPAVKAYAAMGVATIIHNSFLLFLGKTAGDNMGLIKYTLRKYNIFIISILLLCALAFGYVKLLQKRKETRKGL